MGGTRGNKKIKKYCTFKKKKKKKRGGKQNIWIMNIINIDWAIGEKRKKRKKKERKIYEI